MQKGWDTMSHYTTLVLLKNPEDIEEETKQALAPFDENVEMPEYETDCYCIGQVVRNEAEKKAVKKFGTIANLRDSFRELWPNEKYDFDEEEKGKAWEEHIKPYQEYRDRLFAQHPMRDKPDPTCGFYIGEYWESQVREGKLERYKLGQRYEDGSGCGGTGKYLTTYNPKSKWDWYEIGGRWQGDLDSDYERIKDDRNYEICSYCNGTGDRPDLSPPEWKEQCNGCNVCHGTGKAMKFHLAPHMEGNIKRTSQIIEYCPFAILTPDGQWHEKGKMGWWACVSDEKEDWPIVARKILEEHKLCVAVLCDLHI